MRINSSENFKSIHRNSLIFCDDCGIFFVILGSLNKICYNFEYAEEFILSYHVF